MKNDIRRLVHNDSTVIEYMQKRQLLWYRYFNSMKDETLPKTVMKKIPNGIRKEDDHEIKEVLYDIRQTNMTIKP